MNTINKDEAVEVLDNLLELSNFICYSTMNQDKKKIRKRLKKLRNKVNNDDIYYLIEEDEVNGE
jgi:hypothetical protein